jgi:hypothetical protein
VYLNVSIEAFSSVVVILLVDFRLVVLEMIRWTFDQEEMELIHPVKEISGPKHLKPV